MNRVTQRIKARQSSKSSAPSASHTSGKGAAMTPAPYGVDFVDRSSDRIASPAPNREGGRPDGLPAALRMGIRSLSGMDLSDVRVHADSPQPARVSALAYAQGNEIHLGPGHQRHLPHEAWHIVQQRQGRVRPTIQAGSLPINTDPGLEQEATNMGARALAAPTPARPSVPAVGSPRGANPNAGGAHPAASRVLQRILDEDFPHGGTPQGNDTKTCRDFANKVSAIVDLVYSDLLRGNVKGWEGAKFATFSKLLMEGSPYAVPHVGNAVEERVYALMNAVEMGAKWTPQFTEAMGGASKPDIVVNLATDREGLVDITSDRGHILGKAGAWTTSTRYVYVAEAWFPSVTEDDIPDIKAAFKKGGISLQDALDAKAKADDERKKKTEARKKELADARKLYNSYSTLSAFVEGEFKGNRTAALSWMRANGLGSAKGVPKLKGRRKPSDVTRVAMKKKARKLKEGKLKLVEGLISEAIEGLEEEGGSLPTAILGYVQENYDIEMTTYSLRVDLLRGENKGLWTKTVTGSYELR